ncbi:MAG: hypothetical protein N3E51_04325 [Candidatus Micrarchaeota archaeon]|nr:hypothetical protein [Candidatus Micrarchaeota archaeon]
MGGFALRREKGRGEEGAGGCCASQSTIGTAGRELIRLYAKNPLALKAAMRLASEIEKARLERQQKKSRS